MSRIYRWLAERVPSGELILFLRRKTVPEHRHTPWYLFGGLTLFFFLIQLISGTLLTIYYSPAPETAHESVTEIVQSVGYGWFVRGVHVWSSHLLIFCALVHLTSKYFFRAYRKPRELTWLSGVLLMLILFGFAFTGHLLPWDTTGYFATQIGTEIPGTLPFVGPILVKLIRGAGEYVDAETLTRMYSLHTVILPMISMIFIFFHLVLSQFSGSASPAEARVKGQIPFLPDFIIRDGLAWLLGLMILFTVSIFFPPVLGPKADIFASPPPGIKPEWYFLPLFQVIRVLPGTIAGIASEVLVNLTVAVLLGGIICLPWFDRGNGRILRFIGLVFLLFNITAIAISYMTI